MSRRSAVLVALVAVVVTLTLAGCGTPGSGSSSSSAGAHKTSSPSPRKTTIAVTPTPSAAVSSPASGAPSTTHQLPAATPVNEADYEVPSFAEAHGPGFNSPSGNLQCGIFDFGLVDGSEYGYWGCQATDHTWTFASAAPGDPCYNVEYSCGHGIESPLGGPVGVLKAGDIHYPGGDPTDYPTKVLAYGKSVSFEGITCASESDGVTCIEVASGHGFFISKTAKDIF